MERKLQALDLPLKVSFYSFAGYKMTKLISLALILFVYDVSCALQCRDSREFSYFCPSWAREGKCMEMPEFMDQFCKKSCHGCPSK